MLLTVGNYNLNLLAVRRYERQAVYSGPHYLYTRYLIAVRAYLNPGTQADSWPGQPGYNAANRLIDPIAGAEVTISPPAVGVARIGGLGPPASTPFPGPRGGRGTVPGVVSDQALRHQLMQPQQPVRLSVGGVYTLISPLPGFTRDCTNGPKPLYCHVEEIHGTRTWIVEYAFETDVNECATLSAVGQLPIVLSQQYEMRHVVNGQWFTTREINGRVVFRADALQAAGLTPDDFRGALMHPIPTNFKRDSVEVKVLEDGCTLQYKVIDREYPTNWNNASVTDVEAGHSYRLAKASGFGLIMEAASLGTETGMSGSRSISKVGHMRPSGIGAGLGAINLASRAAPVTIHQIQCKAYGHRQASRFTLEQFAIGVVGGRFKALKDAAPGSVLAGGELVVNHDIMSKSVLVASTFVSGPRFDFLFSSPPTVSVVGPEDSGTLLNMASRLKIPGPTDDGLSRGSYLEKAVTAALMAPCGIVPTPPVPATRAASPVPSLV